MVKSRLNDTVNYPELKVLNDEDKNYDADLYEISLFGTDCIIAIGLPKYDFIDKEIIYYPVYIIKDDKVESQIGLYEILSFRQPSVLDEDGEIDIGKIGSILLYSYVNSQYLNTRLKKKSPLKKSPLKKSNSDEEVKNPETPDNDKLTSVSPIKSQDAQQAELERKTYIKSNGELWIQTFMHNKNYAIVENEGGGDCLFSSIRDGLKKSGVNVTVKEMRDKLSTAANEELFQGFLYAYQSVHAEIATLDIELKKQEKDYKETVKRGRATKDRDTMAKLTEQGKKIADSHEQAKHEKTIAVNIATEYEFMKGVETLKAFKLKIKTRDFWGETWAISTLERLMNIKLVLLGREAFNSKDFDNVLLCGQLNDDVLKNAGVFNPTHYIIVEYSGFHFRLVTYKNKGAFAFNEIPYDIKTKIVDKCMERAAGPFYLIPEFKQFMTSLRVIPPIEQGSGQDFGKKTSGLYNSNSIFQFYHQSANGPLPGKGSGETIKPEEIFKFSELAAIPEWRRKLSDFWVEPFKLDGHIWSSIEHFYQASKFVEHNPQFYLTFAIDTNPEGELSKDPAMAKDAGGKTGKHKGVIIRPSEVKIDPDFYSKRNKESKKKSLTAKFKQNKELKNLLQATKDAKLVQFVRASPPVEYNELMEIRKDLDKK